ncbi:MAG: 2-C-methyl-D-erythritol 2,4-cyclodiphosphate synthase [Nitrospirae bacterium]|nr:MAG: 2-C-methyl-D-erythritol 2,4-cyclodiphosphate synthase [Nitrospirota bacterium]
MRVGIGYDVHPLAAGRKLILGGVEVPHAKGLQGHSDADALTHAVCDALLGAMGEGDIGTHFPASDPRYKDIASLRLLDAVAAIMARKRFRLVNLDAVISAQAPKLSPHLAAMKDALAKTMGVEPSRINLKVKSGEGQDAVGREEAMTARAVCLLEGI